MSTENVLCRAKIKPQKTIVIAYIILFAFFVAILILSMVPIKYEIIAELKYKPNHEYWPREMRNWYNLFGHDVKFELIQSENGEILQERYYGIFGYTLGSVGEFQIFCVGLISFSLLIFFAVLQRYRNAKKCQLSLTVDGINGMKKGLFSKKTLNIPFENITSIIVIDSLVGKLFGGQTIGISSATGTVKMICVQNAKEFVDMTLSELKKYKESNASKSAQQTVVNDSSDEVNKMLKLKILFEQGLITQEEFEQKRKELISRM